jgi:hypothetical protein
MDRLNDKLEVNRRALASFREALREPVTPMNRDASIQRFEYTCEAVWKAAQLYLRNFRKPLTGFAFIGPRTYQDAIRRWESSTENPYQL